jgi:hypothetical protein
MTDERQPVPAAQAPGPRRRVRDSAGEIGELLRALGDDQHPRHLTAVASLVALGPGVVPEVARTVSARRPWLAVYNAIDVLTALNDRRALTALVRALEHPNANVRWNAVRGLGRLRDPRGLPALQRAARRDDGRTSWGEPVNAAARRQLEAFAGLPLIFWGRELLLTGLAVAALFFALNYVQGLWADIERELAVFGRQDAGVQVPTLTLAEPSPFPSPTIRPTATALSQPTAAAAVGTAAQAANVRPAAGTDNQPIGRLAAGAAVQLIGRSADGQWLQIALVNPADAGSQIGSGDGRGWISRALVTADAALVDQLPVVVP